MPEPRNSAQDERWISAGMGIELLRHGRIRLAVPDETIRLLLAQGFEDLFLTLANECEPEQVAKR